MCGLGINEFFPSVLWHCWLSDRKGIRLVKKLGVGLLVVMIWLELARLIAPVVTITSIILCFIKHQLTQAHLEKWPVKWIVCVVLWELQVDTNTSPVNCIKRLQVLEWSHFTNHLNIISYRQKKKKHTTNWLVILWTLSQIIIISFSLYLIWWKLHGTHCIFTTWQKYLRRGNIK